MICLSYETSISTNLHEAQASQLTMMCFRDLKRNITSSFRSDHDHRKSSTEYSSESEVSAGDFFDDDDSDVEDLDVTPQILDRHEMPQKPSKPNTSESRPERNSRASNAPKPSPKKSAKTTRKSSSKELRRQNSGPSIQAVSLTMTRDPTTGSNIFVGDAGYTKRQVPWKIPINRVSPEIVAINQQTSLGRRSRMESSTKSRSHSRAASAPEDTQVATFTEESGHDLPDTNNARAGHVLPQKTGNGGRSRRRRSTIISLNEDLRDTMSIDSVESVVEAVGRSRLDLLTDDSDEDLEKDVELQVIKFKNRDKKLAK